MVELDRLHSFFWHIQILWSLFAEWEENYLSVLETGAVSLSAKKLIIFSGTTLYSSICPSVSPLSVLLVIPLSQTYFFLLGQVIVSWSLIHLCFRMAYQLSWCDLRQHDFLLYPVFDCIIILNLREDSCVKSQSCRKTRFN